ncbi:BON domain-containing protein [Luteolibacter sp. LG18]|uniref:BON domain-containing protein n=1 Tax=Luteolibacter sp. LG18 TaxID=2819286 RepID=UPI002B2D9B24|nr:hypothetical protein llg_34350 [Luteolibacter sp. LG18]
MQTCPTIFPTRADDEIASAAAIILDASPIFPKGTVRVSVQDGWITLEGEHEWWFQKNAAAYAVHDLPGVKGVTNLITTYPDDPPTMNPWRSRP